MAAGIHFSEHETDWFIFRVFMQRHILPDVICLAIDWIFFKATCIVVNNFAILEKVEFGILKWQLWTGYTHFTSSRHIDSFQLVWKEKVDIEELILQFSGKENGFLLMCMTSPIYLHLIRHTWSSTAETQKSPFFIISTYIWNLFSYSIRHICQF